RSLRRALSRLPAAARLPMTLIGFSLGARVLAIFLDQVPKDQFKLRRVILLGGAVASDTEDWNERAAKVSKEIVNVYAPRDKVLKKTVDLRLREGAAGLTGIQSTLWKIRDVRLRTDDYLEFLDAF